MHVLVTGIRSNPSRLRVAIAELVKVEANARGGRLPAIF